MEHTTRVWITCVEACVKTCVESGAHLVMCRRMCREWGPCLENGAHNLGVGAHTTDKRIQKRCFAAKDVAVSWAPHTLRSAVHNLRSPAHIIINLSENWCVTWWSPHNLTISDRSAQSQEGNTHTKKRINKKWCVTSYLLHNLKAIAHNLSSAAHMLKKASKKDDMYVYVCICIYIYVYIFIYI